MCRTYHVTTHSTPHYSFGQSRHVMINSTISSGSSIFSMSTGLPSSVMIAMRSPLFHKIKNIHLSFQLFLVFFCEKFAGNGIRIPWNVQLIVPAFPRFLTRKVIRTLHASMLPASPTRSSVHFAYFSHFSSLLSTPYPFLKSSAFDAVPWITFSAVSLVQNIIAYRRSQERIIFARLGKVSTFHALVFLQHINLCFT